MKPATIAHLNELNQAFYQRIAKDFDHTRQKPWEGWTHLLPVLQTHFAHQKTITILDIGCGNGRFGEYLAQNLPNHELDYTGWDTNDFLLTKAQTRLEPLISKLHIEPKDILQTITESSEATGTFDLVVAFGVIHHIPSQPLRQKFVEYGLALTKPEGIMTLAAWQFDQGEKLVSQAVSPESVGLSAAELEPQDYILPWKRGSIAFRYCHLLHPSAVTALLPVNTKIITSFLADGKAQKSNYYLVLEKS